MSLIGPFNKQDLIKTLAQSHQEVLKTISDLQLDDLYDRTKHNWSPFDTLRHLNKCSKPLTIALRLPKFIVGLKWGKSQRPSKQYHEVRKIYQGALARGAKAEEFAPEFTEVPAAQDDAERMRAQILQRWSKINRRLNTALERWPEMYLDKYFLPHPILGKITIREMVMFTIYHNLHHINKVQILYAETLQKNQEDEEEF